MRIAPNHLSIADPDALQVVYGHGTGTLKSNFYDAFVSIQRGLFNTRSRSQHARKRKIVSHIFSQKSVLEFEPHVRSHLTMLFKQWDTLCERGLKGLSGDEGEGGWHGRDGRVWFDCLPWYNYLAFDIIGDFIRRLYHPSTHAYFQLSGDLAFGAPFGMLVACKDSAPVAVSHKEAMAAYGKANKDSMEIQYFPAVQVLNDRGEFSASLGVLPPYLRPLVKRLPWFSKGNQAVQRLAGIAVAAVARRLANPIDRVDLLAKLQDGRDDDGKPMGREELTAEALTQLIAGSDTTSKWVSLGFQSVLHTPSVATLPPLPCSAQRFFAVRDGGATPALCSTRLSSRIDTDAPVLHPQQYLMRAHLPPRKEPARATQAPARARRGALGRRRPGHDVRAGQAASVPRGGPQRGAAHTLDVGDRAPAPAPEGRPDRLRPVLPRRHRALRPDLHHPPRPRRVGRRSGRVQTGAVVRAGQGCHTEGVQPVFLRAEVSV